MFMAIVQGQKLLSLLRNKKDKIDFQRCLIFGSVIPLFFIGIAFIQSIFSIKLIPNKSSLLLVDRHHKFVAALESNGDNFGYWPLPDTIPTKAVQLLVAAEDRRFYNHFGVDLKSVFRAFKNNYITKKDFSGASTIAMQVARMQRRKKRSWYSKIVESFTAIWLTIVYRRERILRQYLTIAPYGNRIAGINYASRRYFQKPLRDLSWAEMALLTAIPNAPGKMNLYTDKGYEKAFNRARIILNRAGDYGIISDQEKRYSLIELKHVPKPKKELRDDRTLHAVLALEKYFKNKSHLIKIDPENPTLRLSLDLDMQLKVDEIVYKHITDLRKFDAGNIALIILDKKSGKILSYFGSDYYYDNENAGQIDYAQIARSTGSLLKPFIYAYGMMWQGYTSATVLTDVGLNFGDGKQGVRPANYDNQFLGPVLYKVALANSRNIPAIQVLKDVGLNMIYQEFIKLNLAPDENNAQYYGLGLAIGGLYCSLFNLCNAYLVLANEGRNVHTKWLYNQKQKAFNQIIPKDMTLQIQRFLSDPQARLPSFPRGGFLEYPFPVAVKTGTSKGYRDAWAIGWSDTYLAGVWVGRHDNNSMKKLNGYGAAAPVLQDVFALLHPDRKEGFENISFSPPQDYKSFKINRLTGELAGKNSLYSTVEYFKEGSEPVVYSNIQRWFPIDKRNNLLASPSCAEKYVELKKFIVIPPIFKDWAVQQGFDVPPGEYSKLCGDYQTVKEYKVSILSPMHKSRIFIDPEMPKEDNTILLNCNVEPKVKAVLWFVNGQEYKVVPFPYKIHWPLKPGKFSFQVEVPYTGFRSKKVVLEIF